MHVTTDGHWQLHQCRITELCTQFKTYSLAEDSSSDSDWVTDTTSQKRTQIKMKLGPGKQLTRTDSEIADVTRPILAARRLCDAGAQVHLPNSQIISFARRTEVVGLCDDAILGSSSAESILRAP